MSLPATTLPYIVRVAINGYKKFIRFEIPRTSTVDSLYLALSTSLETTIQEAHSYELTCVANDRTLDPSMGRLSLTDVVKVTEGRGRTLEFVAAKKPVLSFSICVDDMTESEASSISYCSDSDYTETSSDASDTSDASDASGDSFLKSSVRKTARFFMCHAHDNHYDEINLYRDADQICVDYFYDRKSRSDNSASSNTFRCSVLEAIDHMNHVFRMIAVDRKPYCEIEVDIPFFPAISQAPSDFLKKTRRAMVLVALKEFLEEGINL